MSVISPNSEVENCVCLVAQACPILPNPMDCSPPGSSVLGIFQARILEWVAISFSRGSSRPKDQASLSCIAGGFFTTEPPGTLICGVEAILGANRNECSYYGKQHKDSTKIFFKIAYNPATLFLVLYAKGMKTGQ